jgi:hypothetical protein
VCIAIIPSRTLGALILEPARGVLYEFHNVSILELVLRHALRERKAEESLLHPDEIEIGY